MTRDRRKTNPPWEIIVSIKPSCKLVVICMWKLKFKWRISLKVISRWGIPPGNWQSIWETSLRRHSFNLGLQEFLVVKFPRKENEKHILKNPKKFQKKGTMGEIYQSWRIEESDHQKSPMWEISGMGCKIECVFCLKI